MASDGPILVTGTVSQYEPHPGFRRGSVDVLACSLTAGAIGVWMAGCPNVVELEARGRDAACRAYRPDSVPRRMRRPRPTASASAAWRAGLGSVWVIGDWTDPRLWKHRPASGKICGHVRAAVPASGRCCRRDGDLGRRLRRRPRRARRSANGSVTAIDPGRPAARGRRGRARTRSGSRTGSTARSRGSIPSRCGDRHDRRRASARSTSRSTGATCGWSWTARHMSAVRIVAVALALSLALVASACGEATTPSGSQCRSSCEGGFSAGYADSRSPGRSCPLLERGAHSPALRRRRHRGTCDWRACPSTSPSPAPRVGGVDVLRLRCCAACSRRSSPDAVVTGGVRRSGRSRRERHRHALPRRDVLRHGAHQAQEITLPEPARRTCSGSGTTTRRRVAGLARTPTGSSAGDGRPWSTCPRSRRLGGRRRLHLRVLRARWDGHARRRKGPPGPEGTAARYDRRRGRGAARVGASRRRSCRRWPKRVDAAVAPGARRLGRRAPTSSSPEST